MPPPTFATLCALYDDRARAYKAIVENKKTLLTLKKMKKLAKKIKLNDKIMKVNRELDELDTTLVHLNRELDHLATTEHSTVETSESESLLGRIMWQ